jgi:hypothetical protein
MLGGQGLLASGLLINHRYLLRLPLEVDILPVIASMSSMSTVRLRFVTIAALLERALGDMPLQPSADSNPATPTPSSQSSASQHAEQYMCRTMEEF